MNEFNDMNITSKKALKNVSKKEVKKGMTRKGYVDELGNATFYEKMHMIDTHHCVLMLSIHFRLLLL